MIFIFLFQHEFAKDNGLQLHPCACKVHNLSLLYGCILRQPGTILSVGRHSESIVVVPIEYKENCEEHQTMQIRPSPQNCLLRIESWNHVLMSH